MMTTKLLQQHGSQSTTSFTIHLDTHCVKVSKCALTSFFHVTHDAICCCFSHEKVMNEPDHVKPGENEIITFYAVMFFSALDFPEVFFA